MQSTFTTMRSISTPRMRLTTSEGRHCMHVLDSCLVLPAYLEEPVFTPGLLRAPHCLDNISKRRQYASHTQPLHTHTPIAENCTMKNTPHESMKTPTVALTAGLALHTCSLPAAKLPVPVLSPESSPTYMQCAAQFLLGS